MPLHAPLTTEEIVLRIGLAFLAGIGLGWERERRGRAAGLRTVLLACMAAAVAMILAHYFAAEYAAMALRSGRSLNGWSDPGRLAAGILTGIGFVGGGAI